MKRDWLDLRRDVRASLGDSIAEPLVARLILNSDGTNPTGVEGYVLMQPQRGGENIRVKVKAGRRGLLQQNVWYEVVLVDGELVLDDYAGVSFDQFPGGNPPPSLPLHDHESDATGGKLDINDATTGTLADARLSSNVLLTNVAKTVSALLTFASGMLKATSADLDGGTIDGAAINSSSIGATTAAAGRFTALALATSTELTIASGVVTATQSYHRIDTQSNDSTDDLDTINGGSTTLNTLVLRAENAARMIVIKHGTGNIRTFGGSDITLDETYQAVELHYDTSLSLWMVIGAGGGGGLSLPIGIADGGTGQTTNTAAFNALAPSSSAKGDVLVNNGTNWVRFPAGTDGQFIQYDSAETAGVKAVDLTPSDVGTLVVTKQSMRVTRVLYDSTLGSAGTFDVQNSDLAFSEDFEDYIRLKLTVFAVSSASVANDPIQIFFNNDTSAANYFRTRLMVDDGALLSSSNEIDASDVGNATGGTSVSGDVGENHIIIEAPGGGQRKQARSHVFIRATNTRELLGSYGVNWESTSVISRVALRMDGHPTDAFAAGSRLLIEGEIDVDVVTNVELV